MRIGKKNDVILHTTKLLEIRLRTYGLDLGFPAAIKPLALSNESDKIVFHFFHSFPPVQTKQVLIIANAAIEV